MGHQAKLLDQVQTFRFQILPITAPQTTKPFCGSIASRQGVPTQQQTAVDGLHS